MCPKLEPQHKIALAREIRMFICSANVQILHGEIRYVSSRFPLVLVKTPHIHKSNIYFTPTLVRHPNIGEARDLAIPWSSVEAPPNLLGASLDPRSLLGAASPSHPIANPASAGHAKRLQFLYLCCKFSGYLRLISNCHR